MCKIHLPPLKSPKSHQTWSSWFYELHQVQSQTNLGCSSSWSFFFFSPLDLEFCKLKIAILLPCPPNMKWWVKQEQDNDNRHSCPRKGEMGGIYQSQWQSTSEVWLRICCPGFVLWMWRMCLIKAQLYFLGYICLLGSWLLQLSFLFPQESLLIPTEKTTEKLGTQTPLFILKSFSVFQL